MGKKSRFNLACLDCGEEFHSKSEFAKCPSCDGPGELAVSNYDDSSWADSEDASDVDLDNLAYDPQMFD